MGTGTKTKRGRTGTGTKTKRARRHGAWRAGALLTLTCATTACADPGPPPAVQGVVRDGDAPVDGALVTVRHAESGRAFTVYTDERGRFAFETLPAGPLALEARGPAAEAAPRAVREGTTTEVGGVVELGPADPSDEPRASSFLAQLPDGARKSRVIVDCGGCHVFSSFHARKEGRERTRAEWSEAIARMIGFAGQGSGFPIISGRADADTDAGWLADALAGAPWPQPLALDPSTRRPEGALLTEYDIPQPGDLPHDVAVLDDGRLLVTGMFTHRMDILDPTTGAWTHEPIPVEGANPRAVDVDAAGRWVVALGAPRAIAVFEPASRTWTMHEVGVYPHSIDFDPEGRVWLNGHFSRAPEIVASLELGSGRIERHVVPPSTAWAAEESTIPYGLRVDALGIVWGTQLRGNHLVRLDPASGETRLYPMPTEEAGPRRPDVGADGAIWIPEFGAGKLARFDPETESFTEYGLPVRDAGPYVVRADRTRGTVWLGTGHADLMLAFDPASERFTAYPLPTRGALIRHLDVDERDGSVWAAYGASPGIPAKVLHLRP